MQVSPRLGLILVIGIVTLCGAWLLRSNQSGRQAPLSAIVSQSDADPRLQVMQANLVKLELAVTQAPTNVNRRWALADGYQQIGDLERAKQQLTAIIKLQPHSQPARLALANANLAMQQWTESESAFREVTRRYPRSLEGWQGLAAVLYHQGRYFEAIEIARKAIALKPKDLTNRYLLATSLLEYAMQFPNAANHPKELGEARRELEQLLKNWKGQSDIYYRLGRVCIGLNDGKSAITYLQQAQKKLPQRTDIPALLARAHIIAGDRAKALKVVDQALTTITNDAALYNLHGELLQTNTDPQIAEQALVSFQKAVQLDANHAGYYEDLGITYLRLAKTEEARVAFEQALRLNPHSPVPYQQLAPIYTRLGQPEKANQFAKASTQMVFNGSQLEHIEKLAKVHSNSVPLHLILADRYRTLGMSSQARDKYLLILRLDSKNKRAKQGLAALKKTQGAGK